MTLDKDTAQARSVLFLGLVVPFGSISALEPKIQIIPPSGPPYYGVKLAALVIFAVLLVNSTTLLVSFAVLLVNSTIGLQGQKRPFSNLRRAF
ncbi:hypothetical protein [Peribacillus frigoritolerans]|uniref:hypothetical protein n=1 Tax=Peribacillus frigoritolerans TaxID=450367 RepID=UPI0010712DF5|nr:hypothetical protein [Peribacillus frigoritolerans]TFH59413.1 hypothetical protein E4J71_20105 [Peribacillus frigoritolerans]